MALTLSTILVDQSFIISILSLISENGIYLWVDVSAGTFFDDFTDAVVLSSIFNYILDKMSSCMFFTCSFCTLSVDLISGGTYQTSTFVKLSVHFDHILVHALSCNLIRLRQKGTKVISLFLNNAMNTLMKAIIPVGNNATAHESVLFSTHLNTL